MTRDMAIVPGYDAYFSFSKVKLGYSGVCIYVKQDIVRPACYEGITGLLDQKPCMNEFLATLQTPAEQLDAEGRCLILDFQSLVLLNIYFPNLNNSDRLEFVMDYYACVRKRIDIHLAEGREVVLVGDVNAVHEELDHCDPLSGGLDDFKDLPNRRWLDALIAPRGPLIDTTRYHHPNRPKMFTCWNTKMNARPANFGTRIDYILVSSGIQHLFSDIQPSIMGSDHCPVYADLHLQLNHSCLKPSALLTTQWPEFSQKKISSYFTKSTLNKELHKVTKTSKLESNKKKVSQVVLNEKQVVAEWNSLFRPRETPKCVGHNESCLERTVTKKGQNLGRIFYICSKPLGPQDGPKDQISCNHFSWK
ncbi:unnamed protein product [Rhizopus stolonifer]